MTFFDLSDEEPWSLTLKAKQGDPERHDIECTLRRMRTERPDLTWEYCQSEFVFEDGTGLCWKHCFMGKVANTNKVVWIGWHTANKTFKPNLHNTQHRLKAYL